MRRFQQIFPVVVTLLVFMTVDAMGASPMEQAKNQLETAIYHGKAASGADTVDKMKAHLKHVINCIEGPEGKAFDSSALNPCKGQGNGIIPDLKAVGSEAAKALEHVQESDSIAVSSLEVSDLDKLHSNIDEVINHLEEAKKALGK